MPVASRLDRPTRRALTKAVPSHRRAWRQYVRGGIASETAARHINAILRCSVNGPPSTFTDEVVADIVPVMPAIVLEDSFWFSLQAMLGGKDRYECELVSQHWLGATNGWTVSQLRFYLFALRQRFNA